jgi:hypothetical protein
MPPWIGRAVLGLSAMGFPLTQLVIRRLGFGGAVAVEAVCGGLLVRDAAMLAAGAPSRLRRGPAALLWLEAAAGAAAVLAGLRPLLDAKARNLAVQRHPDRLEAARRAAVGRCLACTPSGSRSTCSPTGACGSRAEPQRRIR